ncbi:uncharacterized protein LOC142232218 [Haematobia irritans]|uniref:uncharacterized protein LOC142232218 n=1 Tax=Haematobia irritans TaxID=7368 RepID=UPI003F5071A8
MASYGTDSKDVTKNLITILTKQNNGLKICHINSQSLLNKIDEFKYVFEDSGMDIICISETWLYSSIPDGLVNLNGYTVFRSDREIRGGGVAIFARDYLKGRFKLRSAVGDSVEYVFMEITTGIRKILIGCIYRPNNTVDIQPLLEVLESETLGFNDVILAGDFNSNILVDSSLLDKMLTLSLVTTNNVYPTHFSSSGSSTLLDLFLVNNPCEILHYDQISASCFSKHDLIFLDYNFPKHEKVGTYNYTYRDYRSIDYTDLQDRINSVSWDNIYTFSTVDQQLEFLQGNIVRIYDETISIRNRRTKSNHRPWFNSTIKSCIRERDIAYSRWKRFRTPELLQEYRSSRNRVNSYIKAAKVQYLSQHCGDLDELNKAFVNVPTIPIDVSFYCNSNRTADDSDIYGSFEFRCVSYDEVVISFSKVKSNAVGLDGIDPKFIRIILPTILPFVTHFFNTILTTSMYPTMWKHAKIIPVPKSNLDFRPISILSYLSKVFEKILHSQMSEYLHRESLLTGRQSGFRPGHSCITALAEVSESLRGDIDDNKVGFLVLLGHSKAFDSVDHENLAMKLRSFFKFSSTALDLITSYLKDRFQTVYSGGDRSGPLPVYRGVPQGSIIGPLLFSLYANDLPLRLEHCKTVMYADDVQVFLSGNVGSIRDTVERLNYDLNRVFNWAKANGLLLNPTKSKCLIIHRNKHFHPHAPDIIINGQKVDVVTRAKNLGVIFNS